MDVLSLAANQPLYMSRFLPHPPLLLSRPSTRVYRFRHRGAPCSDLELLCANPNLGFEAGAEAAPRFAS